MFTLDHDTIEVIKICSKYTAAVSVFFSIIVGTIITYDWYYTPEGQKNVRKLHQMQFGEDLDHIEIALKQN